MTLELDQALTSVAVKIGSFDDFRSQAKSVAAQLDPSVITCIAKKFHSPPDPAPPGFGYEEVGLGGWLSIWQAAVFEVLYNFRETALPTLRQTAFGEYDWTQGYALAALCRLGAEGVDRERTLREIKRELPRMRYEAWLALAGLLMDHSDQASELAKILTELHEVPEFKEALEETRASRGPTQPR